MIISDINLNLFRHENNEILFNHWANTENESTQKPHFHDFCELYIFISGDVGYYIDGKYYKLDYGDIVIVRPNEIHCPIIKRLCEYERFFIKFPRNSFVNLRDDIESPAAFITDAAYCTPSHVKLLEPIMRDVVSAMYSISQLIRDNPLDWQTQAYSRLLLILSLINRGVCGNQLYKTSSVMPVLLEQILEYVNREFKNPVTAEEAARHFGITNSYLSKLFSKYLGIGFIQYLNAKRISHAKILLSSDVSVTEACYECGFSDSSHFISVFKKQVGMTPLKYKKQGDSKINYI